MIFLISYTFATAKRVFDSITKDKHEILVFSILLSLSLQGRGLYNAIVFFVTQNVLKLYTNLFKSCKKKYWDRDTNMIKEKSKDEESMDEINILGHEPQSMEVDKSSQIEIDVESVDSSNVIDSNQNSTPIHLSTDDLILLDEPKKDHSINWFYVIFFDFFLQSKDSKK